MLMDQKAHIRHDSCLTSYERDFIGNFSHRRIYTFIKVMCTLQTHCIIHYYDYQHFSYRYSAQHPPPAVFFLLCSIIYKSMCIWSVCLYIKQISMISFHLLKSVSTLSFSFLLFFLKKKKMKADALFMIAWCDLVWKQNDQMLMMTHGLVMKGAQQELIEAISISCSGNIYICVSPHRSAMSSEHPFFNTIFIFMQYELCLAKIISLKIF